MKNFFKQSSILIGFLLASEFALATVRMVPRPDYAKGDGFFEKVENKYSDTLSGFDHIIANQPLGGQYDLVYQETNDGRLAQVFRCPTVKECGQNSECTMQPKFWQCEQVYESNKAELCRYYRAGSRAYKAATWTVGELASGIIVDQIVFLNRGIGLIINNASQLIDDYELAGDLMEMSCQSNGLGKVMEQAKQVGLVVLSEKNKEQVSDMLKIFNTQNVTPSGGNFPQDYQQAGRPLPLKSVIFDPLTVKDGLMSTFSN